MSYFPASSACNEPNSATPISASEVAVQDQRVAAMGQHFLDGNAALYDLVQAMGGNLPGLIPGSPSGGSGSAPAAPPAPTYAAPGVQAAPPYTGSVPAQSVPSAGVDLGPAVKSMVAGCGVPWAGPSLGAQPAAASSSGPSGLWIFGALGLVAAVWWLGSEGARG